MSRVFCIGNGESRKDFDLNVLKGKGKVYGCNAIYRDYPELIDVLTAVDNGIIHEIYHSGYALKKPCYFRSWTKMPVDMYEQIISGMANQQDLEQLKDYDVIKKNSSEGAKEFVVHGTTLKGMVSIVQNERKKNPKATPDIIQKQINNAQIYLSYIQQGDMSYDLKEVWKDYRDHGWACGASSAFVAVKREQPKEIYLIGHDLVSDTGHINNMYKDTKNYQPKSAGATPSVNWANQWFTLMEWNPNIKFIKVNKGMSTSPTNTPIPEWQKYVGKNLEYITQAQLLDRLDKF